MSNRLYVVEDDLLFTERVRTAARRLGVPVEGLSPAVARSMAWSPADVVVVQATLRPDRQLELVDQLARRRPGHSRKPALRASDWHSLARPCENGPRDVSQDGGAAGLISAESRNTTGCHRSSSGVPSGA